MFSCVFDSGRVRGSYEQARIGVSRFTERFVSVLPSSDSCQIRLWQISVPERVKLAPQKERAGCQPLQRVEAQHTVRMACSHDALVTDCDRLEVVGMVL